MLSVKAMQGKTINGFELKYKLGLGGMAEVWYAENKIGKRVAVKLLLPEYCDNKNVIDRFLTEAKLSVSLYHPNIRQVYDYGELDGRPAMVMEYLDGEDLKSMMKNGRRFTKEELTKWWNQMVAALKYTHGKGVVHRDIKPSNIFIDRNGDAKLFDFGVAKVRDCISNTKTGQKIGTLIYMSPEHVRDSKRVDYRADIYSLAVTFVHLLTGCQPYGNDKLSNFDISHSIVYDPLDMTGVPDDWSRFLMPYLAKNPQERPALTTFTEGNKSLVVNSKPDIVVNDSSQNSTKGYKRGGRLVLIIGVAFVVAAVLAVVIRGFVGRKGCQEQTEVKIEDFVLPEMSVSGSSNGHDYVDLGLPSGILWATCNVGATSPDEFGEYYAWGETYTKEMYGGETPEGKSDDGDYNYSDSPKKLPVGADVANVKWGDHWRLPTKENIEELKEKCKWEWLSVGYVVTGPNGNRMFMPAGGYRRGSSTYSAKSKGQYWSSSIGSNSKYEAFKLSFDSEDLGVLCNFRYYGLSVRPVYDKKVYNETKINNNNQPKNDGDQCASLYKKANSYYNSGDYSNAVKLYNKVISQCGSNYKDSAEKLKKCKILIVAGKTKKE